MQPWGTHRNRLKMTFLIGNYKDNNMQLCGDKTV